MTRAVTRKEVVWEGDSLKVMRTFPVGIQYSLGVEIGLLQDGRSPTDVKPFKTIGPGCFEVRAKDESGAYRAIYVLLVKPPSELKTRRLPGNREHFTRPQPRKDCKS